jgi:DNA-binding LacI/PurR family transcriptional regulator
LYPGEELSWGAERLVGIRRAALEAGCTVARDVVLAWDEKALPSVEWVADAVHWFVSLDPRPTAVICCDEVRARTFAEMLPDVGLHVPRDVSIISFNSTEISERCTPSLTSVRQPLDEIGRAAVDMLLARIRRQPIEEGIIRFPMRLDVRESCSGPATGPSQGIG